MGSVDFEQFSPYSVWKLSAIVNLYNSHMTTGIYSFLQFYRLFNNYT